METSGQGSSSRRSLEVSAAALGIALLPFAVHLLTSGRYGYFRDEFYYIACSQRLDWGYVDHPPLSIALLALERGLLGDSLRAIRFLPALAGGGLVLLTALLTRELGGGRVAQALAAVALVVAPCYLAVDNFYSMNALEPLFWMTAAYILIRIVSTGNSKLWLLFGVVTGLGLENKHSMLFFGFAVVLALLVTPQRTYLADRWFWFGGAIAGLCFLPNIVWQVSHGWPTLEFMRNAQTYKIAALSPLEFVGQQVLMLHPLVLPLWLIGLGYYLFSPAARPYRFCGWGYVIMLVLLVAERAKPYYLVPMYPLLLAGGAIAIESWTRQPSRQWLRPAYVLVLLMGGVVTAPLALPVLPAESFSGYARWLHVDAGAKSSTAERAELGELPQYFADMFGWNELVDAVGRAYDSLPPHERARAAIYAGNYGEAGAINFLGKARHLPAAISGHNNYWLWGPGNSSGDVVIVVGASREELQPMFATVEEVGRVQCRYCMPYENQRPIYICRGLKRPLPEIWPQLKRYV